MLGIVVDCCATEELGTVGELDVCAVVDSALEVELVEVLGEVGVSVVELNVDGDKVVVCTGVVELLVVCEVVGAKVVLLKVVGKVGDDDCWVLLVEDIIGELVVEGGETVVDIVVEG